jgi:hypothetical protein
MVIWMVQTTKPNRINLWLDDIRDPTLFGCIGWVWAKTADMAIYLLSQGIVEKASLDHDLTITQTIGGKDKEKTGYDVVCWMEEHDIWPPGGVVVHSMNPVGKQKMEQVIRRKYYGY